MKCYKCGEDRNFFSEMTNIRVGDNPDSPKRDVCVYCMGWEKEQSMEHIMEIY